MCLAIPGKVIKIEKNYCWIDYFGQIRKAMLAEVKAKPGDMVMVQMGIVIKVLTDKESRHAISAWKNALKE